MFDARAEISLHIQISALWARCKPPRTAAEAEPAGLTANQFGLLAQLYGARLGGSSGLSIGALAELLGTDPSTLNRTLKPLQQPGLVRDAVDPADGRVRIVEITARGRRDFLKAMPLWREAQARVETALGAKAMDALNELLDFSTRAQERARRLNQVLCRFCFHR